MKGINVGALVYLIGAGPGDPGLLTLKGLEALQSADVVVYDYLSNEDLLRHARHDAELVYVGKKGFDDHITQPEINDILIEKASQRGGCTVARLKGGDPFVFGRGGEEALALAEKNIAFEVIPGITSGIAAPAYAGIPVTHRNVASSMAFVTGHEDPTKPDSAINWENLALGVDTICFYMGVKALPMISERLIQAGKSADTPVALVRWGTTPRQEVLSTTLATAAEDVARAGFKAPAIIIVGEVARLREELAWFDKPAIRPLLGKRIVVTRSRTQASALTKRLEALGADVLEFPTIAFEAPLDFKPLERAVEQIDSYDWLVLTSTNGVDAFFAALAQQGLDARALGNVKVATIGPSTAKRLRDFGIITDLTPTSYKGEDIAQALIGQGVGMGTRVLIARAAEAREIIPDMLRKAGSTVDVVASYRTVMPAQHEAERLIARLEEGAIDGITFTSSSTCSNLVSLFDAAGANASALLADVSCYSIGPITSETMRKHGIEPSREAEAYTIDGLVEAIVR